MTDIRMHQPSAVSAATPYQSPTWDGIVLREISLQRQVREGNGGHSNGSLFMLLRKSMPCIYLCIRQNLYFKVLSIV